MTAKFRPNLPRSKAGLARALAGLSVDVRYNERSKRHEYSYRGGDWHEADDRSEASLRDQLAETCVTGDKNAPLIFGRETWERSLNALLYDNEVDPFRAWLEALPKWDKVNRLDVWIPEVFEMPGDQDPELVKWASTFIPLGAVWRTYEPGTKLDEMPVLIGPQGCGKSTALRWLLPAEPADWFADGLNLASSDKERGEALQGRVIVEVSEMAGSGRAELESLKSFLTRTNDGVVRLSYRRNPETMLRRCVLAGTSNDACLPNDPTGNRRFVSIEVNASDKGAAGVRSYLDTNREQIWAEAKYFYAMGVTAFLRDDLKHSQSVANDNQRRSDEVFEHAIQDWLDMSDEQKTSVSIAEVAVAIGLVDSRSTAAKVSRRDTYRIAAVLRTLGYENRNVRVSSGVRMR